MTVDFWKMHGAGNDFVLVDDRGERFPAHDRDRVAAICARRTGVGSDGLILIQPSHAADFRMRFFNPDGGEAEFCGNGARCVARMACLLELAPSAMTIETIAGRLEAQVLARDVRIGMPPPTNMHAPFELAVGRARMTVGFINTGVPHVVVETADVEAVNVASLGGAIRRHEAFAPDGTNVDFAQVSGPKACRVRTYERGVEGETLACGTGITAAAILLARAGRVTPPVTVTSRGGDELTVQFEDDGAGGGYRNVSLTGPAEIVFRGTLEID